MDELEVPQTGQEMAPDDDAGGEQVAARNPQQ